MNSASQQALLADQHYEVCAEDWQGFQVVEADWMTISRQEASAIWHKQALNLTAEVRIRKHAAADTLTSL